MLKFVSFDSNIVQFFGACILEGCPVLVLECMKARSIPGCSCCAPTYLTPCSAWRLPLLHVHPQTVQCTMPHFLCNLP